MNLLDEFTTQELAVLARVARKTVWEWCIHGITVQGRRVRLEYTRSGRRYRIPRTAWEKFRLEICERNPSPS